MLEHRPTTDVVAAVMAEQSITERQKQALIAIYEAFREEATRSQPAPDQQAPQRPAARTKRARRSGLPATASDGTTRGSRPGIRRTTRKTATDTN
jgi:hypothetical protein